jgi:hypothetical protein
MVISAVQLAPHTIMQVVFSLAKKARFIAVRKLLWIGSGQRRTGRIYKLGTRKPEMK